MKITTKWLNEKDACKDGRDWFNAQKETDSLKVLKALIADDKLEWSNWFIVRIMTRPQYLAYAIFAAEQVIGIFEKKYPDEKRPRLAIDAAKAVLKNDTPETRAAARAAAWAARAARAAAEAAGAARALAWAAWAALAAARAAWAAEAADVAWAAEAAAAAGAAEVARAAEAAWAAAWAAEVAEVAWAARAAWAAGAAEAAMRIKILRYGISLLKEKR